MGIVSNLKLLTYFDEGEGETAYDLSGNGNNISLVNTSWVGDGIEADGNGEYGSIDNTDDAVCNLSAGTLILHVTSNSPFNASVETFFGYNSNYSILIQKVSSSLNIYIRDTSWHYVRILPASLPDWTSGQQIAFQWDVDNVIHDGKNLAINVDGSYITPSASGLATSWAVMPTPSTLSVANELPGGNYNFDGVIEYLMLYSDVKTAGELLTISNSPRAVVDMLRGGKATSFNFGFGIKF